MIQIFRPNIPVPMWGGEIPEGSIVRRELMGDHYVTLKMSMLGCMQMKVGDYIDLTSLGFCRFELSEPYTPQYNSSTGGYDYNVNFDAYYIKWKNRICKYMPQNAASETSFKLTSSLATHLNVIIGGEHAPNGNLYQLGESDSAFLFEGQHFKYTILPSVEAPDAFKFYQYADVSIFKALTDIAELYSCEWWVEGDTVFFGKCELDNTAIDFVIGQEGENLSSMSGNKSKDNFANRLYVFGSTRNLPTNYRQNSGDVTVNGIVQKRLMLPLSKCPKGYIQAAGVTESEVVEGVVIIDDVYPRCTLRITDIETYDSTATDEETGETITKTYYRLFVKLVQGETLVDFNFDESYLLDILHMKFESGSMRGMDFEAQYSQERKYFEVVVNDNYGRELPDTNLHPQLGDEIILYGWDSTKIASLGLVGSAEEELLTAGNKVLEDKYHDPNIYTCTMMSDWYKDNKGSELFPLGQKVTLKAESFAGGLRSSRIIGYEIKLDIPFDSPKYLVGETAEYRRLNDLQEQIDSIILGGVEYQSTGSGNGVYIITTTSRVAPSDYNVYSAARTNRQFLRKDQDDSTTHKLTMGEAEVTGDVEVGGDTTLDGDLNVQGDTSLNNTNISRGSNVSFGRDGDYIENEQGGRISVDANGLVRAQVDYLQVNRKMTAKEVEIQEVTHLGGKVLYTAARMRCVKVEEVTAIVQQRRVVVGYKCYFENDDGEGQHIYNQFRVGDQAYCETWNLGGGTSSDFSNQFYWRLVTEVGEDYIVLSADDCASGSTIPRAGDDIVQLGYRKQSSDTDAEAFARQGAIIQTAAESVIDSDKISVPSISLFKGINSYVLPNPFILLSPSESHISSTTINLESGKTLDELVEQSYEVYQSEYNSKEDADAIEQEMADLVASWTTPEDVRDEHVGDFFLAADGFCWMYYRDEETDLATYLWRTVDDEYLTAYVNEISKRTKTFVFGVGEQPYQPNVTYKVGDIWADVDMTFPPTQSSPGVKYDKITLVCISARAKGDNFSIAHWKEWDGTRQLVVNQSATIQQIENNIGDIDASIGSINTSIGDINQGLWVGTDLVWYEAVKNPTDSPKAKGYYELDTYNKPQETEDTSVISGKTYYERKEKQRAGLVTEDNFAGLLAQNDVGTKAEISVSLQSAKTYADGKAEDAEAHAKEYADGKSATYRSENIPNTPYNEGDLWVKLDSTNGNLIYRCTTSRAVGETTSMSDWELATDVDKRISVATIAADKVVIGNISGTDKMLNAILTVQGNYVWAKNLAVEGFLNRGVATLAASAIDSIAFLHKDTAPIVRLATEVGNNMELADGLNVTSYDTVYSFDMLLAPDTLRFTGEWHNTDFVLPFYADLGDTGNTIDSTTMEESSLYYQRPLTNYQKTQSGNATRMTLAQMRALIGRRLYIHNNSTTANGLVFHIGIWFKEYAVNVLTSDGTTTAWAKSVSDEDLVEVVEYNQAYERYRHKVSVEQGKTLVLEFCSGVYNAKVGNDIVATECLYWKIIRENAAQLNEFST